MVRGKSFFIFDCGKEEERCDQNAKCFDFTLIERTGHFVFEPCCNKQKQTEVYCSNCEFKKKVVVVEGDWLQMLLESLRA